MLPYCSIPPILYTAAIECMTSGETDPEDFFLHFSKVFDDMKVEQESWDNDHPLKTLSKEDFTYVFQFLWAVNSDSEKIQNVNMLIANETEEHFWNWFQKQNSLLVITKPTSNVQQQIVDLSGSNFETAVKTEPNKATNENILIINNDEKKKGFENLDASFRQLVLNASAPSCEIKASEPTENCKLFFAKKSASQASIHCFHKTLKAQFNCACLSASSGTIIGLYNTLFTRDHDEDPSNLTIFAYPKREFRKGGHANIGRNDLLLQLKMDHSKCTDDDFNSILKQSVKIPSTIDALKFSFINFRGACMYFFGEYSLIIPALTEVFNHILSNQAIYETALDADRYLIAKVLFKVDTNINLWLSDCKRCKNREDVNDSLIDFLDLMRNVVRNKFYINLPTSLVDMCDKLDENNKVIKENNKRKLPQLAEERESNKAQKTGNKENDK